MKQIKLIVLLMVFPIYLYSQSSGTGFLINTSGYIVTCNHVIENSNSIYVRGINNDFSTKYEALVVSRDKINDLAIIKVRNASIRSVSYTFKWTVCDVGQEVFTLGYPLKDSMGEEIKLTNGIVSSSSGYQGDITTYQITVPIQPGNGGGPLFDKNGSIVGIINAQLIGAEDATYAIKSSYLQNLIQSSSENIPLPQTNYLYGKSLSEQVKIAKRDILIIEVVGSGTSFSTPDYPIQAKTISEAKIKSKPYISGDVIGDIPSNTIVDIVGRENGYFAVNYKGKRGFVSETYFEKSY
jgi:S1-C subfamily serine protease